MFKKNVGGIDRVLRIIVGIALLAVYFLFPEEPLHVWALIGVVPLATGVFSTCPAYSIFGISTCPAPKTDA